MSKYHVIIPSAGSGARMQSAMPKQYLMLNGKPILRHAIEVFEVMHQIETVHIVVSAQDGYWAPHLLDGCSKTKVLDCGGLTRAESVLNGLKHLALEADANDWVLVHDAARPGIDQPLVERLFQEALPESVGAILALPLADTLKRADSQQQIETTLSREGLWQAQTPQMFKLALLQGALQQSLDRQPTDEAQAMEWLGYQPKLVVGDLKNMKITYMRDLQVVSALMQAATLDNQQET
ncbi:2-C-methyl-D-erythritol 4-phosphate cytidylyltransferase [Methylophilus aquaticus]|uniref:2-C-methyl-D-erythritol 4-phosphate cytidylyltransferase n=1 Tax=Methylophilus aquaticus TaxID=1971610 RepID=A0ABT9JRW4_9PROT|nr:2-C-methyl-D-erythritol 4-phosphate cytidylyltransferase [Methylophilus aquaticus]MDP8567290.1 2-C-methyl-D-erythritol 4-phosphate cytidylyltransferase [Methylophilus aquaticus]